MELDEFMSPRRIEWAYGESQRLLRRDRERYETFARQAWRAAKARNPRMLMALDRGSAHLQKLSEQQAGQHGFDVAGYYVHATEFQLWRNAYTTMDSGTPEQNYEPIYLAAGILAGVVT